MMVGNGRSGYAAVMVVVGLTLSDRKHIHQPAQVSKTNPHVYFFSQGVG